jgi:hypothetical protein
MARSYASNLWMSSIVMSVASAVSDLAVMKMALPTVEIVFDRLADPNDRSAGQITGAALAPWMKPDRCSLGDREASAIV